MMECNIFRLFRLIPILAGFLLSTTTAQTSAQVAYPRSSETFVHIAEYGRTVVFVDQFLRAFDVLAYSFLVLTLAFLLFTAAKIVELWQGNSARLCPKCKAKKEELLEEV